jgi:ABC-type multidrug transport system ATPase subunit
VEKICDRVAVINKGTLLDVRKTADVRKKYRDMEDYFVSLVAKAGAKK